jgi:outer membrane protein assembly factor BamB
MRTHKWTPVLTFLLVLAALGGCGKLADPPSQADAGDPPAVASSGPGTPHRPARLVGVYTYHNDLARTGLNPDETILTPANVNPASFGKQFANPVDGQVYAQPLYVPDVLVPGEGRHNMVYVATENDTVYGFDADQARPPLWQKSLLEGGTPIPASDYGCDHILPHVGVTGTPVIDPATGTLYVVAMVKHVTPEGNSYAHLLHALDIATGQEKFGGPVTIAGSVPGEGQGQVNNVVSFDPSRHLNRPGLALANGVVYIAFGSHCDLDPFHGWVFAYDSGAAGRMSLRAAYSTTPNGSWGAIWQAGGAPAIDSDGAIYVMTSNGTFNATDRSDSFVKLELLGNTLRAIDSFTPHDQKLMQEQDLDFGSSGPLLLPTQPGPHPHLAVGADKRGVIYVVDRDRMGNHRQHDDSQIVQLTAGAIAPVFNTPAYWNGRVYFGGVSDRLKAFLVTNGRLSTSAVSRSPNEFGYPGTSPSVSSDGAQNAVVWALQTDQYFAGGAAVLHAYDASNLLLELYRSDMAGARDTADPGVKFTTPTIANGKVFFGTQDHLDVYGLLP